MMWCPSPILDTGLQEGKGWSVSVTYRGMVHSYLDMGDVDVELAHQTYVLISM
jgi:hypothetical protein